MKSLHSFNTMAYQESPKQLPSSIQEFLDNKQQAPKIVPLNARFNRKMRNIFSSVDWHQVNHYMDRLT